MKIVLSEKLRNQSLDCARKLADWLVANQIPYTDKNAESGDYPILVDGKDICFMANNWNLAFGAMGLLAAAKAFKDDRYEKSAAMMMNYLRAMQIFSPFLPEHYGAIREMSPQTPWCYVRDSLSAAWSFLEYYRHTGNREYLERARLWGEWFLKKGMDETQWPFWGVQFEPFLQDSPGICNDMHGCFHGGSLNFFYQMRKTTGDEKWTAGFYIHMADYFVSNIQQEDGLFRTIEKATGKVPEKDPQNGLHRANDDLGTLGLLGAYRLTGNRNYLKAIEKYLISVFSRQRPDGHFEKSCAAVPVVLNILHELGDDLDFRPPEGAVERALQALFSRQYGPEALPVMQGGLNEEDDGMVCARSMCYALIVLLKLCGCGDDYLTC